ncbi:MAG: FAD-binding dehydrogenase [Holophagales bacterium]|nr:FAD-binding dehydrogenase [Holophagales bacterium]MYG31121.1 FAD-binding dehydrogenase [Holophagales bacterium]MYI79390.1 FAD-binding dehydrogenase [Holophagales bacterium]
MEERAAVKRRVVVVGAGNAALCAALAAREEGASVTVLERAPRAERGGNSRFTMAAMRFAYDGLDDLREVATGLTEEEIEASDFGTYPARRFVEDLERTGGGRANPDLVGILVGKSRRTLRWMRRQGVEFVPLYAGQAFEVDGKRRFWGGLTLQARGGGPGLVAALERAAEQAGIETRYGCRAVGLCVKEGAVCGVEVEEASVHSVLEADSVVLASGGFEANRDWRRRYLGEGWEEAKVRGSRYNEGCGIRMALEAGAGRAGQWSGCHAVAWDLNAPEVGNLEVRHHYQKHSYPLGIVVNARGERFLDEGADFRNYTYARYGREVLEQPGRFAWQVFDARVAHLLRDEYRKRHATRVEADSLPELAERLEGVDAEAFLRTVGEFNVAVRREVRFDPSFRDGRSTRGLALNKSNWANPIEEPPFEAFAVTCGITFTFGGLSIDRRARVLDEDGRPIPRLFAAGELVGGLFYDNYPGGSGLTAGAVFGRLAGRGAGRFDA